ncbi:hypothetical protein TWF718_006673 [Orbilia javanica]|uniref:Uncharacterized protein n=1 Tax=Orbilia javanica TaxID=47235 RepID=A0AAN8N1I8_9PEZI
MSVTTNNKTSGPVNAKNQPVRELVSKGQTRSCSNCGGTMYKKVLEGVLCWECSVCKKTCTVE